MACVADARAPKKIGGRKGAVRRKVADPKRCEFLDAILFHCRSVFLPTAANRKPIYPTLLYPFAPGPSRGQPLPHTSSSAVYLLPLPLMPVWMMLCFPLLVAPLRVPFAVNSFSLSLPPAECRFAFCSCLWLNSPHVYSHTPHV